DISTTPAQHCLPYQTASLRPFAQAVPNMQLPGSQNQIFSFENSLFAVHICGSRKKQSMSQLDYPHSGSRYKLTNEWLLGFRTDTSYPAQRAANYSKILLSRESLY